MWLKGKPVKLEIVAVGNKIQHIDSFVYTIVLEDHLGKLYPIEVYGMEKISTCVNEIDFQRISKLFNANLKLTKRKSGKEIDVLIGMQYAAYHPVRKEANGHLLLLENQFGQVVAGSHPQLKERTQILVKHATVLHITGHLQSFFDVENIGISCNPKCGSCRCGKCHPGGKDMSLKEEQEYNMIKEGISFNKSTGRWLANYPWIKDPSTLPNNKVYALATMKSTERRLQRNPDQALLYSQQINDMLVRGAARIVLESELEKYDKGKFYLSHHAVMKHDSKSTPCRIVFNSSAKYEGKSLNDYLAKGPSLLNQIFGILLRFRFKRFAFVGDIKKMFHCIDIPERDQMTHLFLWRNFETHRPPDIYAITKVNMGDKPSSCIAQCALQRTAEEASTEFPEAASIVLKNSYMDDIPASVDSQIERRRIMKDIDTMLGRKGFAIKEWFCSGALPVESNQKRVRFSCADINETKSTEKVLGIQWDTISDKLQYQFKVNIQLQEVGRSTKRNVLSTINSIYDPLGLIAPITINAKIILRKIWASFPNLEWDDPLPPDIASEWYSLCMDLRKVDQLSYSRSLTPDAKTEGLPSLVIFSDGSSQAYGGVAYCRWKLAGGGYESRLIGAKSRVAPIKIIDIVRLELCGAVISKRLRESIQRESVIRFEKVYHLVDSEIVKAMINRQSYGFNTFAANRIGEIHQTTDKDEWWWLSGKLNIGDIVTRGCTVEELIDNPEWFSGPKFLEHAEEEWPARQSTTVSLVPELKVTALNNLASSEEIDSLANRIDINRFSNWMRLKYVTARILKLYKRYKKSEINTESMILPEDLENAEKFWILEAQRKMEISSHNQAKLNPVRDERGIVMVGGRTERWMQMTWNKQQFTLLPKNHRVTDLIIAYMHRKGGHLGSAPTVATIRSKFWVIGVTKLVNALVRKCVLCAIKYKRMAGQIMSPLPVERLKPSPAFLYIAVDYFGPFVIKGEVQKRVRGKAYGVIITCMNSRAVYVDIAPDYSTDTFLQLFRRHASIRGWPQSVFSDNGSQLVSASKELKDAISSLDWKQIQQYGHKQGFKWTFSPADAPWYNGAAEALVKTVKRALTTAIGDQVLTYSELQTCMFEAAQLVNQRPIGIKPCDPNQGTYLSPNDLILGRSSPDIPQGPFKERSSFRHRFDFLQQLVDAFWKRWSREVFPSLVVYPKWHTERRNVTVGDIVVVQDSNCIRGEWRKAIVTKADASNDGRVRRVTLEYVSGSTRISIERPVQRIIVLVPKSS